MRRGLLALVAATLAASGAAASAAPPPVEAPAYIVRGPHAVVLAARAPDVRRAPASITKLMTVLVALEHARLDDIVTVTPQAAGIGESTVHAPPGRAALRSRPRDRRPRPERKRRRDGARGSRRPWLGGAVRGADEREGAVARPHLDPFREPARARPGRPRVERPRRRRRCSRRRSATRSSARGRRGRRRRSPAAGCSPRPTACIGKLPLVGAKTGHTDAAGWSQVAAVERDGVRITASVLGSPSEAQRNADLGALLTWGLAQYRPVKAVDGRRVYGLAETGYGRPPVKLVALRQIVRNVRVGRPLVERVVASSALALPVARGQHVGEVRVFAGGRLIARAPLVAADSVSAVGTGGRSRGTPDAPSTISSGSSRSCTNRRKGPLS